jgi:hypothetical protein
MTQVLVNAIVLCFAAHMLGDYVIQSDWMAQEKTKSWLPAVLHGLTYAIPFIPVVAMLDTRWPVVAWLVIAVTHIFIDHYRLARHLVWLKNQLAPYAFRPPHTTTGHGPDRPDFLTVWLLILVDNIIHMAINVSAVLCL